MSNRVNSKQKGGRFERSICKWFTQWTGYEFNRVPASGGLRWKNAENITSDVACTDTRHSRRFCFSVECKSYKDLNFEHILLQKKTCKILKFWKQASEDANRAKKLPILIMKYNGMPKGEAFVMINRKVFEVCIHDYTKSFKKPHMTIDFPKGDSLAVMMLSDLKSIPYKEFHLNAKTLL